MKREDLLKTREYWLIQIQNRVFSLIEDFRKEKKLTKTQIAEHLGVTKGYVSQILHGDYDHKISKLVDLALSFNKAPVLMFTDINQYIKDDKAGAVNMEHPIAKTNCVFISIDSSAMIQLNPVYSEQFLSNWEKNIAYGPAETIKPMSFHSANTMTNSPTLVGKVG